MHQCFDAPKNGSLNLENTLPWRIINFLPTIVFLFRKKNIKSLVQDEFHEDGQKRENAKVKYMIFYALDKEQSLKLVEKTNIK